MSEHDAPPKRPVDYDELFPGRFLKAGLFKEKPVTLAISGVLVEKLPRDDGSMRGRGILSFAKTEMQLALNTTNGQCIRAMFGTKLDNWIGKRITFVCEQDKFGRETVDAIRIAGSPDLQHPLDVEIRLPRKKPRVRRLEVTGKRAAPRAENERAAANPDDPDSYG